jgi:arylsulfatase A-like enzyme
LHTGLYPHSTGVLGLAHAPYGWRLKPGTAHTARILGAAGYSTVLVGMQHLVERASARELGYTTVMPVTPAYEEADAAVAQLRELSSHPAPFYLEVGFEEPHRPYDFGGAEADASRGVAVPGYLPAVPEARQDLAAFQGAIRQMDTGVGRILNALDELGIAATTCVIFATDHGAAMPRAKCTLYDPGIEVALLWRWPSAGLSGGRVISDLVSNVDVTPTLFQALDLPPPSNLQGRSLWPLLTSYGSYVPRSEVFAEKTFHTYYEPMRAIRTDHHKLIVNFEVSTRVDVPSDVRQSPIYPLMLDQFDAVRAPIELYDLAEDRWEKNNLAGSTEVASLEAELRERLLDWMRFTNDPLLHGPVASPYYAGAVSWLTGC